MTSSSVLQIVHREHSDNLGGSHVGESEGCAACTDRIGDLTLFLAISPGVVIAPKKAS